MILNNSCFAADVNAGWDHDLQPYYAVLLAAAFEARPDSVPVPVDASGSIHASDVHFGAPGQSSVRFEADFAPEKPRVDVLAIGHACAPQDRKADRVTVSVRIGGFFKQLVVTGDRTASSRPRPFSRMPIVYERAYGGSAKPDGTAAFPLNPVGIGHRGARAAHASIQTDLPNVEYADGKSAPAGFGPISRQWQPRLGFAGTYDDKWMATRCPLLPADFDLRYFQAAPLDQQLGELRGGEPVEVLNMTPEGVWRFRVPTLHVPLRLWYADRGETATLRVDTILLEPDEHRFTLKARVKIPMVRNRGPLRQVIVGHVTPGWWRARLRAKEYFDPSGRKGRLPAAVDYSL